MAHLLSLAGAGVLLMWLNRRHWFFGDEWDFIALRSARSVHDLFAPHNEHWSTLPMLVYRGLLAVFGLRSYLPYAAVVVCLHLALAHLLWRLMLRGRASPLVATVLAAVFLVLGSGAENFVWAFQIGFVSSVLFGWLGVLAVDRAWTRKAGVLGFACVLVALMSSGIGVVMTAVVSVTIALRHGPRRALLWSLPAAAVFTAWYAAIGHHPGGVPDPAQAGQSFAHLVRLYPSFVWVGMTNALGKSFAFTTAGSAVLVVIAIFALLRRAEYRDHAVEVAGAIGVVLFFAFVGVGRVKFGVAEAIASRYVYIATALVLPMAGWAFTEALARIPGRRAIALGTAVGVLLGGHNLVQLRYWHRYFTARDATVRRHLLGAAEMLRTEPRSIINDVPDPANETDLTVGTLLPVVQRGWLPTPTRGEAEVDRLTALAQLGTNTTTNADVGGGQASLLQVSGAAAASPDSCVHVVAVGYLAQILIRTDSRPAQLALTTVAGGSIQVVAQETGTQLAGDPASFVVPASTPTYLRLAPPDQTFSITLPASGVTDVCGLRLVNGLPGATPFSR